MLPERGGWQTLGPTDAAFGNDAAPVAMAEEDINGVIRDFASAAARRCDVFIGRAALADPRWWQRAAHQLGYDLPWVPLYQWPQPQNAY